MGLAELQGRFPRWNISTTPKGVWVARRKRHLVLTNERIDHGYRDCLIEEFEEELEEKLTRQEDLEASNTTK